MIDLAIVGAAADEYILAVSLKGDSLSITIGLKFLEVARLMDLRTETEFKKW
jgi:hypothetical protein